MLELARIASEHAESDEIAWINRLRAVGMADLNTTLGP